MVEQIVKKEINDFDWVRDVPTKRFFIINQSSNNRLKNDEWISIEITKSHQFPVEYKVVHYNLHPDTKWYYGGSNKSLDKVGFNRLINGVNHDGSLTDIYWHEISELPNPTLKHHRVNFIELRKG